MEMESVSTGIVGLTPNGGVATFCSRITRAHLIGGALIFLCLLSISLLIVVVVQAQNPKQNIHNNDKSTTIIPLVTTTTTNNNTDQYCLSIGCLSAATHQLRSMDITASSDRCTDFYKYACGGWQKTHPIQSFDVERTILSDILSRRDADIERLLNSPISRISPKSWEWKVKTYYTECLDDYAHEPNSGEKMVELIQRPDVVDGWFLFDNSADNDSQDLLLKNQTVYQQMSHIHGDLGVPVIFGLRTRFDEIDSTIKRLEFFPAGLTMSVNDYLGDDSVSEARRVAYQYYILEVLALLAQEAGISDRNLGDRIVTIHSDVFLVERTLADNLQHNKDDAGKPTIMTLKEMSDQYSFDFVELMTNALYDPSIVSGITEVYVTNPKYFLEAFQFLAKNNEEIFARLIHNYMRWHLVRTYIEDLSYNYVHTHRVFLDKYYDHELHSTNEAYCTREVIRRFPLAIQRLYTMNSTTHADTMQTIETMFNSLKDGFTRYIDEQATWMTDEATKTIARQKIDRLTAAIGYATIASDDGRLDDYYENFVVDDKSHLENAVGYQYFHAWMLSNSLIYPDYLDHWDLFETRTSRLFDYIAIFNRLFVIASGAHEPLVSAEWPWAMNMGSLGVLLAQKLFATLDGPEGRVHSANGTRIPDWWSPGTANAYNTSRQCITDYYVNDVETLSYNIFGTQVLVPLTGEPFSPTTLRHIGALRFAHAALKKNDQIKSFKMPGTNFTGEQTFFLAYAQTQCYQREELMQYDRTCLGVYDERTALNAALVHTPEFTEAFQCTSRDHTCF